jgi:hypothetical protein
MVWDWEISRTLAWTVAVGFSLGMFVVAELEVRRARRLLARSQEDLGISRRGQAAAEHDCVAMRDAALLHGEKVREGLSREISLALDTLVARKALTEREKSVLMAVAYHAAPLEQDGRLLSDRILSQLAFEDAISK